MKPRRCGPPRFLRTKFPLAASFEFVSLDERARNDLVCRDVPTSERREVTLEAGTLQRPVASPFDLVGELTPENFGEKVNQLWESAGRIKDAVIQEVARGEMPEVCGFGIVSCITGQAFGYQLFHGQPNQVDLLSSLYAGTKALRQ